MAQKKISQLPNTETVVLSSDLLPIVNEGTTKNIVLSAFFAGIDPQTTIDSNVRSLSGSWESVYNSVQATSANWDSVYSSFSSNSATYDNASNTYLALTGGTISGDLTITGGLSVLGDTTSIETLVTTTSAFSVTNVGTGPALTVTQTGSNNIAVFYDDSNVALTILDGGNVGIGEADPTEKLTVSGSISASGSIYDGSGVSDDWNSVYASVQSTSANWDSVYSAVANTSANFDSVYSSVINASANWDSVYNSVQTASADSSSVYSSVVNTSANWDSVYSSVANTSAVWDSTYTSVASTSANWDSVYSNVASASAGWDSIYSAVNSTSAVWDSTYTSVASTSANWDLASNYSTDYSQASSSFATTTFADSKFLPLSGATTSSTIVLESNTSIDLLRITQLGSGNAIVVEDSSNPDSSPFVVTATGNVGIGASNPSANLVVVGTVQQGNNTIASGSYSHAEGTNSTASGSNSHAEGSTTIAFGNTSHAAGYRATATHDYSYAWSDGNVGAATSNTTTTKTGQYMVSASGGVFFPGKVGIGTDDNSGASLTVVGDISASGNYRFGSTSTAPSNTTTPVTWIDVYVGATAYKMPLYQ